MKYSFKNLGSHYFAVHVRFVIQPKSISPRGPLLSVWDEITRWSQFHDHIIRHQTSNWSLLVKTVNCQLSQFYFISYLLDSSLGVLSGRACKDYSFIFVCKTSLWFSRGIWSAGIQKWHYACMPHPTEPLQC